MLAYLLPVAVLLASSQASQISRASQALQPAPPATQVRTLLERPPEDRWDKRPTCDSMFLSGEWRLSGKQKACDWVKNRMFSSSALAGAVWAASTAPIWDRAVGRPSPTQGFPVRFATNFAQNAFKSTGTYLGGAIQQEDPRQEPPFLIMQETGIRHGFFRRVGHALQRNVVAYHCSGDCATKCDIKPRFALSRVTGSLASGFGPELWQSSPSMSRGLRGSATAYGATFVNSLFSEFKPELGALAGRLVSIF